MMIFIKKSNNFIKKITLLFIKCQFCKKKIIFETKNVTLESKFVIFEANLWTVNNFQEIVRSFEP